MIKGLTEMPESSKRGDLKETVRVVSDYSYKPDGQTETISLKVGEEYQLVKKVNETWWFVQKSQSSPPFYVPATYVQLVQKSISDIETGGKSPVTASGGKSPGVAASGKSLDPGSPSVSSPTAKVAPKPKPRMLKSSSEDDALKVLDAAIDAGEKRDAKSNEAIKPTPLLSISEIHPDKKFAETLQGKDNTKAGESAKAPSVELSGESSALSTTLNLPSPSVRSASLGSPGVSTLPAPTSSPPLSSHLISPSDEINYVNLDEYKLMVKDRVAQTAVAGDNPLDNETADMTTVAIDNPAESETSDYRSSDSKGGSRESIDSDSQGKSCDMDSIGAKEELENVDQVTTPLPVEDSVGKPKDELVLHPKPAVSKLSRSPGISRSDYENIEDLHKMMHAQGARKSDTIDGKIPVGQSSPEIEVPSGWTMEMDDGVKTFVNPAKGEKWTSAVDNEGRNYFYNVSTHATVWKLSDSGKDGKTPSGAEGAIAEAESTSSEAAAEFPALEPLPIKMVQKQGQLSKAKVDLGKKSKKLSWSQSYAVLMENGLYFYKDQKKMGKPEFVLDLNGAQITSSPDEKKKEILVLTLAKGDVYYLHNENEEVLQHWKQSLENNITVLVTTPPKDVKDLSIMPAAKAGEMSRLSSYIGLFTEDRLRIADKLLHWLKRRPTKETLRAKGILKEAVFGSSLKDLCEREKTKIPRFVHECIVAVEKRGLDVEGVYRVGGNMASVQKLRQMADNNEFYDLNNADWDVHVVTGALKLFFRELSEPLFTFALFTEFLDAYKAQGRTRQLKAIRDVVRKLPTIHRETMKELFKHLTDVIRHGSSNRMNSQALAIVFGPTLLWPQLNNKDMALAASMVYQGQVVEFMIVEFKAIFS